ncbi:hypothetical protein ANCCAN_00732 [Ancylostoma caninum]|uniref:Uncharacterized protein n=1 Tax=Ancylostoma caninum TaxID=29170 RepID=A0A368HBU9_ANCCA|nr:hypothetical protein ANCCAN_00732 [Ancylostoma caninum]
MRRLQQKNLLVRDIEQKRSKRKKKKRKHHKKKGKAKKAKQKKRKVPEEKKLEGYEEKKVEVEKVEKQKQEDAEKSFDLPLPPTALSRSPIKEFTDYVDANEVLKEGTNETGATQEDAEKRRKEEKGSVEKLELTM